MQPATYTFCPHRSSTIFVEPLEFWKMNERNILLKTTTNTETDKSDKKWQKTFLFISADSVSKTSFFPQSVRWAFVEIRMNAHEYNRHAHSQKTTNETCYIMPLTEAVQLFVV